MKSFFDRFQASDPFPVACRSYHRSLRTKTSRLFSSQSSVIMSEMVQSRAFLSLIATSLLVLFAGVNYLDWFSLDSGSSYGIYLFNLGWLASAFLIFRPIPWRLQATTLASTVAVFFALASGFAVYEYAPLLGHAVPFEMKDPETVVFLLLVGPLMEELIYRFALWRMVELITRSAWLAFALTSAAYAYAHYQVLGSLPPELHAFIRYQTLYTFALALFCGGMRMHVGVLGAIFAHFAFNFGFWIASF